MHTTKLESDVENHYTKVETEVDSTFKELIELITKKYDLVKSELAKQKNSQLTKVRSCREQLKKETTILESENVLLQMATKTTISVADWNKLHSITQTSLNGYQYHVPPKLIFLV